MAENNSPQEAWNMATETLKRLSRDLDLCSFYAHSGQLIGWFNSIMDLRRNLAPFLDASEFKEIDTKLSSMPSSWISNGKTLRSHHANVHKTLDETYILMINFMKSKGLLMPKSIDPRAAVISN